MRDEKILKVELVEVLRVELTRGQGANETDPIRPVYQYWHKDGRLLAENDEHKPRAILTEEL